MPTTTIELQELAARFDEVLSSAAAGTEIIVTEGNVPRAKLIPVFVTGVAKRVADLHPGAIEITDDFDDPLPDEFWLGKE